MNKTIATASLAALGAIVIASLSVGATFCINFYSSANGSSRTIPTTQANQVLATEALKALNRAVQDKDFATYHSTLSPIWQKQITPEGLGEILAPFVTDNVEFNRAVQVTPLFDQEPVIDEQGVLFLSGEFPAVGLRALFEFKYYHHDDGWRVIGFNVKQRAHEAPVPTSSELTTLVNTSLEDFRKGVESGSFSTFHQTLATPFSDQYNPGDILSAFQQFVDRKIDLARSGNSQIVLDGLPALNQAGVLSVKGHYLSENNKVDFLLHYLPEYGDWKLLELDINTKRR